MSASIVGDNNLKLASIETISPVNFQGCPYCANKLMPGELMRIAGTAGAI